MTEYPCVAEIITEFEGGPKPLAYFSKGHHTGEELLKAVKWAFDESIEFDPAKVRQIYFRSIPMADLGCWLKETKPGRGAFPVTMVVL